MELNKIYNESNLETMARMPDNSVDAIVTDPPYGLGKEPDPVKMLAAWLDHGYMEVNGTGFMGQKWDAFVPQPRFWKEAYRVLKPGGHVLSFFGTRTYDWGVMAMRLAGFEVRDQIAWVFGSGFPKSHDISKAIDKAAGVEREVVGEAKGGSEMKINGDNPRPWHEKQKENGGKYNITAPATPEAQKWNGWGSALKPAIEPIVLARKPLGESSIAANVLKWGTGGLNVDGCRVEAGIEYTENKVTQGINTAQTSYVPAYARRKFEPGTGRFPANLCHDGSEEVEALFPQTGTSTGGQSSLGAFRKGDIYGKGKDERWKEDPGFGDSGSASRFFYCAKADAKDRNWGLPKGMKNRHPTVKPHDLCRWLVRLVTPPGGVVYDPYCGSGSIPGAAMAEGFRFIASELDPDHTEVARRRVLARRNLFSVGK